MDRDLRDRSRLRESHRLPGHPEPGVTVVGRQPRLHRPEPVVRTDRRCRSSGLPAFRPGSRRRRAVRARARGGARRSGGARHAADAVRREDDRFERTAYLHPDREGARAERGVDVCKSPGPGAGSPAPGADDGGISRGETACGPCARRLQPECVGPDARVRVLGASAPGRRRVHAGHVGGSRAGYPHRGLHPEERAGASPKARRSLEATAAGTWAL